MTQAHHQYRILLTAALVCCALASLGCPGALQAAGAGDLAEPAVPQLLEQIEDILPDDWAIVETEEHTLPRFWIGPQTALYVRIEDRRTTVHHPKGFDYHPFYKLWFCPSPWEGFTQQLLLYGGQRQALLLGSNANQKVFYFTQGADTWPAAPNQLREALSLHYVDISHSLSYNVDYELEIKLHQRINLVDRFRDEKLPQRLLGLEVNDRLAYIEFVPRAGWAGQESVGEKRLWNGSDLEVDQETAFLAEQCFLLYPDLDSLYLRRIEGSKFLDVLLSNPYLHDEY